MEALLFGLIMWLSKVIRIFLFPRRVFSVPKKGFIYLFGKQLEGRFKHVIISSN